MRKITILSVAFLLILVGCDTSFVAKIYVSDFFSTNNVIHAKAVITTEFSKSKEKEVIAVLKQTFDGANNFRKETTGYSETIKFDYNIKIVEKSNFNNTANELFSFVFDRKSSNEASIGVKMNNTTFDSLNRTIKEEFYASIDLKDLKFVVELNNDTKEDVEISVKSSYLDGKPIPFELTKKLIGRDNVEIEFSEILKESLVSEDIYYFLNIKK